MWAMVSEGFPGDASGKESACQCRRHRRHKSDAWIRKIPGSWAYLNLHQSLQFSSVQSLSHVQLFVTLWTAAHQAPLSITNSWSLLKLMSIESVMPSNHLILCHPLLPCLQSFPASRSFQMSQLIASGGQSIGVSALASVLPMNLHRSF